MKLSFLCSNCEKFGNSENMLLVLLMKNVQETSAEHNHLDGVQIFQIQKNLHIESWILRSGGKNYPI